MSYCRPLLLACLLIVGAALPASAEAEADKATITERLQRWAAAFNARDAGGICDLFADKLISTVPGALDSGRDAVCGRLAALLAKPDLQFHYQPDIREIIVSGDIAVVRLFWTLTTKRGDHREVSKEAGMDIFERQPSGTWSIIRFVAFTVEPTSPP
ncbi:nuclear transport factor 2 family protein [Mesorhizobium sp. M0938]|uniref:YybH family protein n=1 Tax=unclassified Mesorhizobium TaxID=325217 RepID=UPI00333B073F